MKICNSMCSPICDSCRMFNFNGKMVTIDGPPIYDGHGYCVLHEQATDPGDRCEDFVCTNYKKRGGYLAQMREVQDGKV